MAPILRSSRDGMVLQMARWGLPSPPQFNSPSGIDRGVTNVRNVGSPHWRRWLGSTNRCLVPLTRFAEPREGKGAGNAWFDVAQPALFAGLWVPQWTSLRTLKDGQTTDDLYAFLTTDLNAIVAPIHPKAMPVILTTRYEWDTWLPTDWKAAAALQRPLVDGLLRLVETGHSGFPQQFSLASGGDADDAVNRTTRADFVRIRGILDVVGGKQSLTANC